MKESQSPIVVTPVRKSDNNVVISLADTEITIRGVQAKLVQHIIDLCNGRNTLKSIVNEIGSSGVNHGLISAVIEDLESLGVVVATENQWRHYHDISSFPDQYATGNPDYRYDANYVSIYNGKKLYATSDRGRLFARKSIRSFTDDAISIEKILEILSNTYSVDGNQHTVASAGGIYPLRIFVISIDKEMPIAKFYEYNQLENSLTECKASVDYDAVLHGLNSDNRPFNAGAIIIVTAQISLETSKYGNRGYRFALMECGAFAQNLELYCAKSNDIGMCQLGGFLDNRLQTAMNLPEDIHPLLGIAIGHPSDSSFETEASFLYKVKKLYVGADKPITSVELAPVESITGFFGARATLSNGVNAFGTSRSSYMAEAKAIIEGYERSRMYVNKEKYGITNSSGISAYTDYETASQKALMELIERDAIVRNWREKSSPNIVDDSILPIHALSRKKYWHDHGRTLYVIQMPSRYAYVIQTIVIGDEFPCFTSGSAAGYNLDDVISKSMQEAEFSLASALMLRHKPAPIKPSEVVNPSDHELLYAYPNYAHKISWLWSGAVSSYLAPPIIDNFYDLKISLDYKIQDLSEEGSYIKVVRAVSPQLESIHFGYHGELPHYFA